MVLFANTRLAMDSFCSRGNRRGSFTLRRSSGGHLEVIRRSSGSPVENALYTSIYTHILHYRNFSEKHGPIIVGLHCIVLWGRMMCNNYIGTSIERWGHTCSPVEMWKVQDIPVGVRVCVCVCVCVCVPVLQWKCPYYSDSGWAGLSVQPPSLGSHDYGTAHHSGPGNMLLKICVRLLPDPLRSSCPHTHPTPLSLSLSLSLSFKLIQSLVIHTKKSYDALAEHSHSRYRAARGTHRPGRGHVSCTVQMCLEKNNPRFVIQDTKVNKS